MKDFWLEQSNRIMLTPFQTMEIILNIIYDIIPYELAVILSREENEKLKVRYVSGPLKTPSLSGFEIYLKEKPDIKEVLEEGKVKLVEETIEEDHHDTYEGIIDLPTGHSCMLIPLKIENNSLGLMTLDHRECDIFTSERVRIAESLSKLISIALAQSLLAENLKTENAALIMERSSLITNTNKALKNLVGESPEWVRIIEKIKLVAPTDSPVMILGETGTGKEEVAKAIHSLSERSQKPFITLNCSALNSNLAESELFGHEKGAFTGAIANRKGRFELADGGTLFLDEIGDLPVDIQPKLLRAIQEGTFEKVGGEKTLHSDVRIICATNVDLEEKIKAGEFREDLYYRLNVFPLNLPPLRKRKGDIILLANFFLLKLGKKFSRTFRLSIEALEKLKNHYWHGNVRELQNTLERSAILAQSELIDEQHIIFERDDAEESIITPEGELGSFDEETKKIILKALHKANGKIYGKNGAAELLDIKPSTLQSKMKKLGIKLN